MGRRKEGYKAAPWVFKGRAIYQLNLVRIEEARRHIPADLHIVNFFGYTLGGFYLARYDDSPVGPFDEALCGTNQLHVAGPPGFLSLTGLPSRFCAMTQEAQPNTFRREASWWDQARSGDTNDSQKAGNLGGSPVNDVVVLAEPQSSTGWQVWKKLKAPRSPVCEFSGFPPGAGRKGPRVRLKLPSFSGMTETQPEMLHYTCQIDCRLRTCKPLKVTLPGAKASGELPKSADSKVMSARERFVNTIGGRPVMAIAFDDMEMTVQEPRVLPDRLLPTAKWEIGSEAPSLIAA